jgi:predicted permease
MLACAAGLVVDQVGIELPEVVQRPIQMLGQIAIPLMLFALGVRLVDMRLDDWRVGLISAFARPLISVLLAWGIAWAIDLPIEQTAVLIVFAALPPAVINTVLAERYGQEPERVASIVLLGNAAAIITLPLVLLLVL